ncbi:Apoptosis inhibitor 5 [Dermatophagoides farinae]|uniref:Apoptosis inhibitor 5 n=1 Tax=Dermatophagoides farinae TaxID=6954 RepID=A0A922LAS8_DERFA|nr:Apoptosis inhibitor 5 [Dermatophagoides farinae]
MASIDPLDQLYEHYNKLDSAKENIKQFESDYLAVLNAVHGSSQEKQFCSQFISKFFVHFPDHYESAIELLLDLCEDDDPNIRLPAIKELPNICRDRKELVTKICDVLAQLLLSEDPLELNIVNQALITLANYDIKSFLFALFVQILDGEGETRDRVVKFFGTKFRTIKPNLLTKEIEEFILENCKKILIDATKEEFITLMTLLAGLKISKTVHGHNNLLAIVKDQSELNNDFIPNSLDKFLMCVRHGIPYFSQFSPSTEFVQYICLKILPHLAQIEQQQPGLELEVLQALSEIISFVSPTLETSQFEQYQNAVFQCLLGYIPKPPEDLNTSATDLSSTDDLPSTQFSHVECLLYSLHQLCKLNPKYFEANSKANEFKDFKLRLQYLARDQNDCIESNIEYQFINKRFFRISPSYKTSIQLSFKSSKSTTTLHAAASIPTLASDKTDNCGDSSSTADPATITKKRPLITAPEGSETTSSTTVKRERKFYQPPVGKFNKTSPGSFRPRSSFSRDYNTNNQRFNQRQRRGFSGGRVGRGGGGFRHF